MRKIRIFAFLLMLLIILPGVLASCTTEQTPGPETTEQATDSAAVTTTDESVEVTDKSGDTPEPPEPVADVLLADQGTVKFKITSAQNLADDVKESVTALYESYKKRANNGAVPVAEALPAAYDAEEAEILIGDTGYAESVAVMNELSWGDWIVCFRGEKLVIAGYSRDALRAAITGLIQTIKAGAEANGTITVKGDLRLTGTVHEMAGHFTKYESASAAFPLIADEGQDTALAVVEKTTVGEYEAYLGKLESEGYTLYTSNTIGENRFATYKNDRYLVHVGWYAYEKAARITIEECRALVGLEADNIWTPNANVTSSLAQIGLGTEANNYAHNGMSYCIQLADGSFIVIDGGFAPDADRLYNYMKAKSPDGKIVIAAWFITHNDPDHYRAFVAFAYRYGKEVTVEYVVKNMPSAYTYMEAGDQEDSSTHAMADSLEGCKVIKAHTGMKFFLRNAEIEMLFTIDGYLPTPLRIFNNSSLVFTVTIGGERILFTGDMSDDAAKIVVSMYGNYLQSDFVQLAHHGLQNGHGTNMPNMISFYEKVRAEVALWPNSMRQYMNAPGSDLGEPIAELRWNLEAMKSARETWLAGEDYITVFELPYTHFSAYRFDSENPNPAPVAKTEDSDPAKLTYAETANDSQIAHISWKTAH